MKLSAKYAVTILLLLFCVVVAFAGVILVQFRSEAGRLNRQSADALRQSVLKQIRDKETNSVRVLTSSLTNPMYQLDMLKIGELVSAVRQQPDVLYIYVFDPERKVIFDGTQTLESYGRLIDDPVTVESMRTSRLLTEVAGDAFQISAPIKIQNTLIGGIKIGYSVKRIFADIARQEAELTANYHAVAAQQLWMIGLLALGFSVAGVFVAIFLGRSWSTPITLLSQLTARVGAGDYEVVIPVERSDEIGQLANAFRQMVLNLKTFRQRDLEWSENLRIANLRLTETNSDLVREVAERQRAEREVTQQNAKMHVLHEITSAISSTLDRGVLIETLLDKFETLLPYAAFTMRLVDKDKRSLIPLSARNIDISAWIKGLEDHTHIDGKGFSQAILQNKSPVVIDDVQTDPRVWNQELFRKHGLVSYVGVPIITEGEVLGVLGFYTAEPHQFEAEEIGFLSTLAGQVAVAIFNSQLYEQLKAQAIKLIEANKTKDEFLSVMSHELRTPLNVIMGYAQVLTSGIMGDITPEQEKSLKKLMLHADDLLSMINNVLQAGRLQSGLVDAVIERVELGELLEELKSAYEYRSKQDVALIWQLPADSILFETDRSKLKHIIQNLINNAVKFTEEGSVTVSARILIEAVEIEVRDTGIGIPSDSLETIFEMFRQADSSKTRTYGGTGVGLYIVKKFTESLNGRVSVASVVARGTTFTVTLPLAVTRERHNAPDWDTAAALATAVPAADRPSLPV